MTIILPKESTGWRRSSPLCCTRSRIICLAAATADGGGGDEDDDCRRLPPPSSRHRRRWHYYFLHAAAIGIPPSCDDRRGACWHPCGRRHGPAWRSTVQTDTGPWQTIASRSKWDCCCCCNDGSSRCRKIAASATTNTLTARGGGDHRHWMRRSQTWAKIVPNHGPCSGVDPISLLPL